jgi:predicted N-acetyltransferase YhbS/protein-S-isoprenylcysteine O-methyltransferase Ste14
MNTRELTAPYFVLQSLLVSLWWLMLWLHPPSRLIFLPPGGADILLPAFLIPDFVLIVAGGLIAGALCRRKSESAGVTLWIVVGALSYETLFCLALSFFTNSAWISVAMMSAATFMSIGLALVYTAPPQALFRQARPASPLWNLAKTLAQGAVFWSFFLLVLPALIIKVEDEIGVPHFYFSGQREGAAAMFGLLSLLGLWGGITISLNGQGTPLPLDGARRLVTRGPYAYLRNPMAVAGLGQGLLVGLYVGSTLTILYVIVGGLFWNYIVRPMEEADMARKFGPSYDRYLAEVKCWRPRLTPFVIRDEAEGKIVVRPEKPEDIPAIRIVNEQAFGSAAEADLVDALRRNGKAIISLVADHEGHVVGHILFSPVTIETNDRELVGVGLAPMAVIPESQNQRIGSMLVEQGVRRCREEGHRFVVVLGHPGYYPRFGFVPASRFGIKSEYDVADEVFMVLELREGALSGCSGAVKYQPEFNEV